MAELTADFNRLKELLKNSWKVGNEFSPKPVNTVEYPFLEKGDEFTMPMIYEIFTCKIGERTVDYIEVELKNGQIKNIFPSVFVKTKPIYNEDGSSTGKRAFTKGTAAELFRKQNDIIKGMEALKGKTLRVTDIEYIRTIRVGTTQLMTTYIPTIDIVE